MMSLSFAIEIDVPFVKAQAQTNKEDVASRTLLMKYYLQRYDYMQAKNYADEILALDAKHKAATSIKHRIKVIKDLEADSGIHHAPVSVSLHTLFNQKAYKSFLKHYKALKLSGSSFDENIEYDAASAYFKVGNYANSAAVLELFPNSKNKKIKALKEQIILMQAQNNIVTSKSPKALNNYIYLLNKEGNSKKTIKKLKSFVNKYPENIDAKIALAQNIYWSKDIRGAFHTLYSVRNHNHVSQKLYANILYDLKDYKNALYFLPKVSHEEHDKKEKLTLEKRMAFAYRNIGEKKKSNKILQRLIAENPHDKALLAYQDDVAKNALLKDAIFAHKAKNYDKALRLYRAYYDKSADAKIAKEIAEIYYFNKKEKLALPYYKAYLAAYPNDSLIRFHYASAFEKEKSYQEGIIEFKKIIDIPSAKEYHLAQYHYSSSLMQTYQDADWYEARRTLKSLVKELDANADPKEEALRKSSNNLLKTALGKVRKPTKYKDITLTEGSYKQVKPSEVFSAEDIRFVKNPSSKSLLGVKTKKHTPQVWMGLNYVDDSLMTHHNYKIGVNRLFSVGGFKYGMHLEKFDFQEKDKHNDGVGVFVKAQKDTVTMSVGLEHFNDFDTIVPHLSWSPNLGSHNLLLETYYRNGAFINYRKCMIEKKLGVYHVGLYDSMLLENLDFMEIGLDINHFEDDNTNFYGQFSYPLLTGSTFDVEHALFFNENVEYNTKTTVCSKPMELYDTSYLKYRPKIRFRDGSIELSGGAGYSFKNKEVVYSYGINGSYTIDKFATLSINCERLQSSFTNDDMNFCSLNVLQAW